eukprot:TRINITY_DN43978_c0_g1_i1.p2 TRINITY_DN43978_c0_g1~~TRINITY_DN43978_c0_g1_i1.p2  ORF type:complete len:181 (+),score=78.18 TRINITY_DN43978_c0_g1_i1:64-543(+)
MPGLGKANFVSGALYGFLNWGCHFVVSESKKKRVAVWTGLFLHFIAAALIGLSVTLLVQSLSDRFLRSQKWDAEKRDMALAYVLFWFAGLCLSSLGVFLRDGSWAWHIGTLAAGIVLCTLADANVRMRLRKVVGAPKLDKADVWEVQDPAEAGTGLRRR